MWQGNTNNPVPTNNNVEKNNPIVSNVRNIALDTRRDEDAKKNFTVSLLDIDTALIGYIQNIINPYPPSRVIFSLNQPYIATVIIKKGTQ